MYRCGTVNGRDQYAVQRKFLGITCKHVDTYITLGHQNIQFIGGLVYIDVSIQFQQGFIVKGSTRIIFLNMGETFSISSNYWW